MTSQSTMRQSRIWMDRDNDNDRLLRPDKVRVSPDRNMQLMKLRKEQIERRLHVLRTLGRTPRIALNGQPPVRSLTASRQLAQRMGWQVPREQTFTDCLSLAACEGRHGWARVKDVVKEGFADGVVALTRATVTSDLDAYEAELDWLAMHSGFLVLVHAENVVPT